MKLNIITTIITNLIIIFLSSNNLKRNELVEKIPDWYKTNRVQIHTRLFLTNIENKNFNDFPKRLESLSVKVLTRQIKSHDEGPWWNSKYGEVDKRIKEKNIKDQNLAIQILNQSKELNLHTIVYYRHMEDKQMYESNPDWASINLKGNIIKTNRGISLCINSPYRYVVKQRIAELIEFGSESFYFDSNHMPSNGCFCQFCKEKYRNIYNSELIQDFKENKLNKFYEFRNNSINEFFNFIKDKNHENILFIVGGRKFGNFTSLEINEKIFKENILKSELTIPSQTFTNKEYFEIPENLKVKINKDIWNSFSFTYMKNSSFGPPHIWCARLTNKEDIEIVSSGLISLGCIANIDVNFNDNKMKNNLSQVIEWNSKYEKIFQSIEPYFEIIIPYSEKERNKCINEPNKAWSQIIYPAYYKYSKLYAIGIPLAIKNINQEVFLYKQEKKTNQTESNLKKLMEINLKSKEEIIKNIYPSFYTENLEELNLNLNYYKNKNGDIYIITGNHFGNSINFKNRSNNRYENKYQTKNNILKLNIKKDIIQNNTKLTNVTTNKLINSKKEKEKYKYYEIELSKENLNIIKIENLNN